LADGRPLRLRGRLFNGFGLGLRTARLRRLRRDLLLRLDVDDGDSLLLLAWLLTRAEGEQKE
jgi:hypothetical protein